MDVHEYLGVLRRGLVFIVLGVLIGLIGGAAVQSMEGPSYAATSRNLVTNKTSGDLTEWLQASNFTESRIASYVVVASSGLVLQPVIDDLGLDATVEDLARRITVTTPPSTFIIEITATANSPEEARDIANAVSTVFADVVSNQLETTNGSTLPSTPTPGATPGASAAATPKPSPSTTKLPNGTVVPISKPIAPVRIVNIEEAALPTAPLPSNSGLILIVGGVLGLAVGLLAASLREAFDTRVRGPKDIAAVAQTPVVGDIPVDRAVRTNPLVAGGGTPIAEAFRTLRAHIDHLRARDGRRSFVVTAAGPGQGATTVTANLAVALANTATSVVVVDADLRSSALSRLFGIHDALGLSEVLAGRVILDAALRSGVGGVTVLPAGARPSNPGELLATSAMRGLLADLRARFDVVLIDAPPISVVTDAAVLGSFESSTLLVLAEGTTTRPRLEEALVQLGSGGSSPVGIVLNSVPRGGRRRSSALSRRSRRDGVERPVFAPAYVPAGAAPAATPSTPASVPTSATPEPAAETPVAVAPASRPAPAPVAPQPAASPAPSLAPKAADRRVSSPSHLAAPISATAPSAAVERAAPRGGHRRVTAPAGSTPQAEPAVRPPAKQPAKAATPVEAPARPVEAPAAKPPAEPAKAPEKHAKPAQPAAKPAAPAEPARASGEQVTEVEHPVAPARDLDYAFAALPTATAAEQRAGALVPEIESSKPSPPAMVERPIVIKPDPVRPVSRFAPDPTRFSQRMSGAYANAPAPTAGTAGKRPEPQVTGTVVNTVSIKVQREVVEAATVPPPIRHILPRPGSTIPPKAVESARPAAEPELVELHRRTGPVPVPPLAREPLPMPEPEPEAAAEPGDPGDDPTAETRAIPAIPGSLLGEIGGLPRVEVRAARPAAVTDTAPNPEREARESYEQRARQLERVAHERLMREQQRLAVDIREQLAHDKRELESVLDNRLEDTVLSPVALPRKRAQDPRFGDPADDAGDTR